MATDIHIHIEKLFPPYLDSPRWIKLGIPDELIPNDRDYEVFGFLAGVRCQDYEPQFPDRGLPKDSYFNDHNDFYHHTYAYLDEIRKAPWVKAGLQFRYFPIFFSHVLPRLIKDCPMFTNEEERNIRCVMAFDS